VKPIRITAITGTRADYDLLYPVLQLLEQNADYDLLVLATGAHLSHAFGTTIEEVRRDGWNRLVEVPSLLSWDEPLGRVTSMSTQLAGLARVIEQEESDMILVLGDREEPLLGAMIGTYYDIPVAHIFGGDSGYATPDDKVRHAVSQLADLHFTASARSRERVIASGAPPQRVHHSGNPGLDRIRMTAMIPFEELTAALKVDLKPESYLMVTFHPLDRQRRYAAEQMEQVLRGALATGMRVIVNSPNSDSGNQGVRTTIEIMSAAESRLILRSNLPRHIYVNLLRNAACLVGNSSAGILEAPYLQLPVVNAGDRQREREHVANVRFTDCNAEQITAAIHNGVQEKSATDYGADWRFHFGDGRAAELIMTSITEYMTDNMVAK
jgi:GDP/UDP-N,N'-diacetylbacillosamine 2-epimerase (hydrolysing)